jgi:VanZ family protein
MPATGTAPRLPTYLAIAYALLIAYACLHPLTGWRASGLPLFDYLVAPWPKYYRVEDLVVNVLGYVPLGFVLVPALAHRTRVRTAIVVATLLAALLSLSIETIQNFLPSRISSNVDLGCNVAGGFIGALGGASWGRALFDPRGWLHRWRTELIVAGRSGDLGLILLGLWLLAQLMPDSMLFGSGDWRRMLNLPTPMAFDPERFIVLEAILVGSSAIGVGLLARCMMRSATLWPIVAVLALGVAAKSLATFSFFVPGALTAWLTPGTRLGLLAGLPLLTLALLLPRIHQHALAGMALLVATTLANLIPENPYLLAGNRLLERGNFLNFHGLTQIAASSWPFIALAYLSALGLWRGEHLHER